MGKCYFCNDALIREYDTEGTPINFWQDAKGNNYCDQCFWVLYTVPEEKAIDNYHHKDKRVRERARKKIKELEKFWGIRSV